MQAAVIPRHGSSEQVEVIDVPRPDLFSPSRIWSVEMKGTSCWSIDEDNSRFPQFKNSDSRRDHVYGAG